MHFKIGRYKITLFKISKANKDEIFFSCGNNSKIFYPYLLGEKEKLFLGKDSTILANSRLQSFSNYGITAKQIKIGNNCYIGFNFSCLNASSIVIGNNVLIASNVLITSLNHGVDPESEIPYMNQNLTSSPVEIGDNCWIGEKVVILPGVKIGKYSVIGAGSIVTKSIPDYSMAVGNPAKVIKKYNFDKHCWGGV